MFEDLQFSAPVQEASFYADQKALKQLVSGGNEQESLERVAKEFESLYVNMMLKTMRQANAAFTEGSLFESRQTEFFREMLDNQYSVEISRSGGIGIAKVLIDQLSPSKKNEDTSESMRAHDGAKTYAAVPRAFPLKASQVHAGFDEALPSKKIDTSLTQELYGDAQSLSALRVGVNSQVKVTPAPRDTQTQPVFDNPEDFIEAVLPHAEMAARKLGVDPRVLVAQAALETGWGKHIMANGAGGSSYNLFGIKAGRETANQVTQPTLEYDQGTPKYTQAQFRVYESFAQSFDDYADLLQSAPRYRQALATGGDSAAFAAELQAAGYATDPHYAKKIQSIYVGLEEKIARLERDRLGNESKEGSTAQSINRISVLLSQRDDL